MSSLEIYDAVQSCLQALRWLRAILAQYCAGRQELRRTRAAHPSSTDLADERMPQSDVIGNREQPRMLHQCLDVPLQWQKALAR